MSSEPFTPASSGETATPALEHEAGWVVRETFLQQRPSLGKVLVSDVPLVMALYEFTVGGKLQTVHADGYRTENGDTVFWEKFHDTITDATARVVLRVHVDEDSLPVAAAGLKHGRSGSPIDT